MAVTVDKASPEVRGRSDSWQLKMLRVSVKKTQKLRSLIRMLRPPLEGRCLLITCGDNNGAINYRLRDCGGAWSFCDLEPDNVAEMSALLDQPVVHAEDPSALPFPDNSFDCVVTIDCQEHLDDPVPFTREVARITRCGGRAIVTVPNGNEKKLAVRLKNLLGMTKEFYGHKVVGYDIPQLREQALEVGLEPGQESSYSRLFTELVELGINFLYVKVLSRKDRAVKKGQIAPTSGEHLKKMEKIYKIYRLVYPVLKTISLLDVLVPFGRGYAVVLEARKPL